MNKNDKEIKLRKYMKKVDETTQEAMIKGKSAEELKDDIAKLCVTCLLPQSEECEICFGNSFTVGTECEIRDILEPDGVE